MKNLIRKTKDAFMLMSGWAGISNLDESGISETKEGFIKGLGVLKDDIDEFFNKLGITVRFGDKNNEDIK